METKEKTEKNSICPFMSDKTTKVPCMKSLCAIYHDNYDQCELSTIRVALENLRYDIYNK